MVEKLKWIPFGNIDINEPFFDSLKADYPGFENWYESKKENNALLQENGKIVFLRATLETLAKRLKVDGERPLLQASTENIRDRLARLLKERAPVYEHVADYVVDVDGKTPEKIAKEIVAIVGCERV